MGSEPLRMNIPDWIKALRRRLGYTSADTLAAKIGRKRNAVARWENGSRTPNLEAWRKLINLAPADLRMCAPEVVQGLGLLDFEMVTLSGAMAKGYVTKTSEAGTVAEELDSIEEPHVRRRARNAALKAIEDARSMPPQPPLEPLRPVKAS